jgi:hypothetical protein
MLCPQCNVEVASDSVFCHKCGMRLDGMASPSAAPSPGPVPNASDQSTSAERLQKAVDRAGGPEEPERELWRGGYSSKAMIGAWLVSSLSTLVLLVIGFLWVSGGWWWLIVLLIVAPWLYFGAVLTYRCWGVRYLLTTQRFIHELGILRRVSDRIEVLDMDDIVFEQSLLDRLFGVGSIRILSHDISTPRFVLRGIDDVRRVANLFDDARIAERRRRGLHIENI